MVGYAAVLAANLLTKGSDRAGAFRWALACLYLWAIGQLRDLRRLSLPAATGVFLLLSLPWHVLAAMPEPGDCDACRDWAFRRGEDGRGSISTTSMWRGSFGRRIPHDYGQHAGVAVLGAVRAVWMLPWAIVSAGIRGRLRARCGVLRRGRMASEGEREAGVSLLLWPAVVLGFFTISARQEYYSLPALPALALLAGGLLARAEDASRRLKPMRGQRAAGSDEAEMAAGSAGFWSLLVLVPIGTVIAGVAGWLR